MAENTKKEKRLSPEVQTLRDVVRRMVANRRFKTQAELATKLGIPQNRLSMLVCGRAVITQEFRDTFARVTGIRLTAGEGTALNEKAPAEPVAPIEVPVPDSLNGPHGKANRVLAVVTAMNELQGDDVELLENLIAFRTGGEGGIRKVISAIQDITIIKDLLR